MYSYMLVDLMDTVKGLTFMYTAVYQDSPIAQF